MTRLVLVALIALPLLSSCAPPKRAAPSGTSNADASAPASSSGDDAGAAEELELPRPTGIAPLVPWMPASAWSGKGAPPKQFSLFAVPDGSPVLGYAALDRDACEGELRKRGIAFTRA